MANLVPRSNLGASLGTSVKNWLKGWFQDVHVSGVLTNGADSVSVSSLADVTASRDRQMVNASAVTSTTSLTPVDIPGMTLTTAAGSTRWYEIHFSCEHENTNADKVHDFALVIDGVTVMTRSAQSNKNGVRNPIAFNWLAQIAPAKVIKVQFATNANTISVYGRTLTINGQP